MELPCGCEERKEVMFTQGNPDIGVALLIGVPLALVLFLLVREKIA